MAASPALPLLFSLIFSSYKSLPPPFSVSYCSPHSRIRESMFLLVFFFTLSLLSISILVFSLYSKRRSRHHHHRHHGQEKQETQKTITCVNSENATSPSETSVDNENNTHTDVQNISGSDPNVLSHSILLEILPSDSPGWAELFRDDDASGKKQPYLEGDPAGNEEEEERKKKRKKRGKKKRPDPNGCGEDEGKKEKKEELVCLYPFTTSTSATQRKIKQQYDQLVKSHESNSLTLAQVGQFVNCLVESKKELQHRSEVIQRKFTITKALLLKADRSSFNRLRQQIYKLELEQKRLEEDAFVYNWLQQQLKLSPAYKKMLEIGSCMEMKAESCEQAEGIESEVDDISFEELLAQEKKDAFWQRNGKSKS